MFYLKNQKHRWHTDYWSQIQILITVICVSLHTNFIGTKGKIGLSCLGRAINLEEGIQLQELVLRVDKIDIGFNFARTTSTVTQMLRCIVLYLSLGKIWYRKDGRSAAWAIIGLPYSVRAWVSIQNLRYNIALYMRKMYWSGFQNLWPKDHQNLWLHKDTFCVPEKS